jgi:hypothetical protein
MSVDPMDAIRGILDPERRIPTTPLWAEQYNAEVALAAEARTANKIAWYNTLPKNSPTAQLLAAQIEDELGVQS